MNGTVNLESEIKEMLRRHGELSVAFITRFLNETGLDCTRQRVERTLRRLVEKGLVEAFYTNGNKRKHYRLR
jgi:predicted transcriptional regulator